MNEKTKKILTGVILLIVFILCLALVIIGHQNVGPQGLMTMLLGLAGMIFLLWLYNRQYK